jgi:hypothetical protein
MAHFAELDKDNLVTRVVVTNNNFPNEGYDWLLQTFGGRWIQTSYNARIRKNFAGVGFTYDEDRDAFIPPKPFESWMLNEETCDWQAPKPYPTDGQAYTWNEDTQDWIEVN